MSQYFPFNVECQTRELLVPFLLHLWYDVVLDWGLNPGPPALEASTLPLSGKGIIIKIYYLLVALILTTTRPALPIISLELPSCTNHYLP